MNDDLEARAKTLYDANDNRASCPPWENLGDVTRGVWRGKAAAACRKCGGEMKLGVAMGQTYTDGSPDFIGGEVVTVSAGGPGKLMNCMKCSNCGWSTT